MSCKIRGWKNLYAKKVSSSKYVVEHIYKGDSFKVTNPITKSSAKEIGINIPKRCK